MELIERYLNEVGQRLPKSKRDDICDELRSTLDDALEDRSIGRPTETDVVAMLNEFGSPQSVAASYSGDRYLIGPELYPQFITILKIVATALSALVVLGTAVSLFTSSSSLAIKLADMVSSLIDTFITSLGIVVIVFALLESLDLKIDFTDKKKTWNPLQLPAVRDVDIIGRFESIAGVVFPAIVLVLINQFKDHIGIKFVADSKDFSIGLLGDPGSNLLLNDVFLDNLPWINISMILPMALSVWLFWSGRWNLPTRLLKISFDVFGLYVFYRILQGVIAAKADLLAAGIPDQVVTVLGRLAELAPYGLAIAIAIGAVSHLYKAFRS